MLSERRAAPAGATVTARGWRLNLAIDGRALPEPTPFDAADLAACLAIRCEVFVGEQRVPVEEEMDGRDGEALHVLLRDAGHPIATARLLLEDDLAHVGRVAVLAKQRRRGAGRALMAALPGLLPSAITLMALNAQTHALGFYERLGYTADGEAFMEAGIPHVAMIRTR